MSKRRTQKKIIIIAGPNGAGKTTFAQEFLPHEADCPDFINADLIARGLSPFAPEKVAIRAGRIMLEQIAEKVRRKESFSFESTLAGRNYARHIPVWRNQGYHVKLIFLSLPSSTISLARIKARVKQGGHDVAEPIVQRRFDLGFRNFHALYKKLVDEWEFYDNSSAISRLIEAGSNK